MIRLSLTRDIQNNVVLTSVDYLEAHSLKSGLSLYGIDVTECQNPKMFLVISPSPEVLTAVRRIVARLYNANQVDDLV